MRAGAGAACVGIVLAALLVSGCGGSGQPAGPAAAVPARPLFYMEVALHPRGATRAGAEAALGQVLRAPEPGRRLGDLLQEAFTPLSFRKDVEPWLGDRAAVWVSTPADLSTEPGTIIAIQTRDEGAARSAVERGERRSGKHLTQRKAGDADYELESDGTAFAVHDGMVLVADQEGQLRRALTLADSGTLAASGVYRHAVAGLARDRLGTLYYDPGAVARAAGTGDSTDAQIWQALRRAFPAAMRPSAAALAADGRALRLVGPPHRRAPSRPPSMAQLPAGTWAALAVPDAGDKLSRLVAAAARVLAPGTSNPQMRAIVAGLGTIRDVRVFVRGTTPGSLDFGVVTRFDTASTAAGFVFGMVRSMAARGFVARRVRVPGAGRVIALFSPRLRTPLIVARRGSGLLLSAGIGPVRTLARGHTFARSPLYRQAASTLGRGTDPWLVVSMPALLQLVDNAGRASAGFAQARPYLQSVSAIVGGEAADGDTTRVTVAAAFPPSH